MSVVFDIETGPLPMEEIRKLVEPFSPPPHPGEFDPSKVKYGQAKKEDKRAEILEAARKKHAEAVENYARDVEQAEREYWDGIMDRAALSAITGQVLAIGYRGEKTLIDCIGTDGDKVTTERLLLVRFWNQYKKLRAEKRSMIGFNIAGFDIPFLVQRSWINEVPVPDTLFNGPQRYLDQTFIDLMKFWQAGSWGSNNLAKLGSIARAFGIGAKPDGVSGADFYKLFFNPEKRSEAVDYLANDLDMSWKMAERLAVV